MSNYDSKRALTVNFRIGGIGAAIGAAAEFVVRRLLNPSGVCAIDQWATLFSSGGFLGVTITFIICAAIVVPSMYYLRLQVRQAQVPSPAEPPESSYPTP